MLWSNTKDGPSWYLLILASLSFFFLGRLSSYWTQDLTFSRGIGAIIRQTFQYNSTFSVAPSNATSAAWRSIYPRHGGFFDHPDHGERVSISVFHQLHCLDGIRHAYWQLKEHRDLSSPLAKRGMMAVEGHEGPDDRDEAKEQVAEEMVDPAHVRHCIDYLRQSLMCHGDATIEVKPVGVNGVRGFGIEHQCRDWERLRGWVEGMQKE